MTQIPTLADVVTAYHDLYPPELAESWDASGLIAGRGEQPVSKVLFAVDAISATAEEAVESEAGLLITHHPLLLKGANFIPASGYQGSVLHTLIENKCGLLAAHTNSDAAVAGVNECLAEALGMTNTVPLADAKDQELNGATYSVGIGRVGELPEAITLKELAEKLAKVLPATAGGLRIAGKPDAAVQKIAICGGAGDSLFDDVRAHQADVYITADLRHHPASELRERALLEGGKPYLIDCSHFASEWVWLKTAAARLKNLLAERGFEIETQVSALNSDPWDFQISSGDVAGSASTR